MDAAYALLIDSGYAGTTMTAVAERAVVAVPTVYKAFGSKTELVKCVYDRALAGDDTDVSIGERPQARRILAETDPTRAITHYAALVAETAGRIGPLLSTLLGAQSTDPQLREFVAAIEEERRHGNERFVAHLRAAGMATPADRASDLLWLFTAPDVYLRLVAQRRWSADEFAVWLAATLVQQLLPIEARHTAATEPRT
jgi:AcrR family transcriptional regulator